ncbi:MAG TPA: hydantoinase/oxoprolinase family protein, partial [Nocardioidaceae bacterium]|nr:hydantoinase/oxoprolinase family protein [Nocardioidaceae bacterium]
GEIPLDTGRAWDGVEELAKQLGLSVAEAAVGLLEISAWNQANALRQITVKRGLDVRDFTLTTFGGSGSLLLCRLVDILDLPAVLVPPEPGNVSAFGLLTVDVKNDYVQTSVALHETLDPVLVTSGFDKLSKKAGEALSKEGFAREEHLYLRTADLRYFGQAFEVRVPVPDGRITDAALSTVADAFHAEHKALYGYDFAGDDTQQVEWVNLRVSGIGPIQRPKIVPRPATGNSPSPTGRRSVCFDAATGYRETPVYWREELAPGNVIKGPAIIEEFGSTVPLHPGFVAHVDAYANLIVRRVP